MIHALIAKAVAAAVIALIACILSVTTILAPVASAVLGVAILISVVVVFSLTVVLAYDFFEEGRRQKDIDRIRIKRDLLVRSIINDAKVIDIRDIVRKMSEASKDFLKNVGEIHSPEDKTKSWQEFLGNTIHDQASFINSYSVSFGINKAINETKDKKVFTFLRNLEDHITAVRVLAPQSWLDILGQRGAKAVCHIVQVIREKCKQSPEVTQNHRILDSINSVCLQAEVYLIGTMMPSSKEMNIENPRK